MARFRSSRILGAVPFRQQFRMAPAVGFEPTTNRLTADRSTTELRWIAEPHILCSDSPEATANCLIPTLSELYHRATPDHQIEKLWSVNFRVRFRAGN